MLTVEQALSTIVAKVRPFEPASTALADSFGLILAADAHSDVDSPPFDKSLMDGFAVRVCDLGASRVGLEVIEEVTAGRVPTRRLQPGQATQIMTGAPLPEGADAVVPVEQTEFDAGRVTLRGDAPPLGTGANIMRQATSMKRGDVVVAAGRQLRAQELGALAESGQHQVFVRRRPRAALLATGDELVSIAEVPAAGQIRNSNETMLVSQIQQAGAEPVPLGIARDNRADLSEKIRAGLKGDLLLLSGGVSAGKLDLVPSELEAAGVSQVFHKVQVKPGKPLWFGVLDRQQQPSADDRCYVFGLPGNPVSAMVCFELFVRTAISRLLGREPAQPQGVRARLTQEHIARGGRPTYHPARLEWTEAGPVVSLVRWHGSSDLQATVDANAMALIGPQETAYRTGDELLVFPWDA